MAALGIEGVAVGHWTDHRAATGCTVVVLPDGTRASGEVRGGAPATRDFELLRPERLVPQVDAVVLAGGSAFGLAACDGVMTHLRAAGRGFPTRHGRVPIVVGMALYDLGVGDPEAFPGREAGAQAIAAAVTDPATGPVGAGTGATVGNWRGADHVAPGGLGIATSRREDVVVTAVMAVNPSGDIDDGSTVDAITAGTFEWPEPDDRLGENTIIGVVVTNAVLDANECLRVAQSGHDGLARCVVPPHTRFDGDAIVAAATGSVDADGEVVRLLAVAAVEQAIRGAVGSIDS